MKWKSIYSLLFIVLFWGSACRSDSPEEEIAQGFCECFQKMTDLYRQVQSEESDRNSEELLSLMEELEAAAAASETCVDNVETEYGDLLENKEEEIKTAMKKRCPEIVETLEEIDAGYE